MEVTMDNLPELLYGALCKAAAVEGIISSNDTKLTSTEVYDMLMGLNYDEIISDKIEIWEPFEFYPVENLQELLTDAYDNYLSFAAKVLLVTLNE